MRTLVSLEHFGSVWENWKRGESLQKCSNSKLLLHSSPFLTAPCYWFSTIFISSTSCIDSARNVFFPYLGICILHRTCQIHRSFFLNLSLVEVNLTYGFKYLYLGVSFVITSPRLLNQFVFFGLVINSLHIRFLFIWTMKKGCMCSALLAYAELYIVTINKRDFQHTSMKTLYLVYLPMCNIYWEPYR